MTGPNPALHLTGHLIDGPSCLAAFARVSQLPSGVVRRRNSEDSMLKHITFFFIVSALAIAVCGCGKARSPSANAPGPNDNSETQRSQLIQPPSPFDSEAADF